MIDDRFGDVSASWPAPAAPSGFLMIPVAPPQHVQSSPLEWLYQRLYEEAAQVHRQPQTRDLFAVMN